MKDDEIKVKIAEVAKQEFLELGYVDASMRNISAKAGLTTGSLYNRFKDKAELFEYIVGQSAKEVLDTFQSFNSAYSVESLKGKENISDEYETSAMKFLIDKMFDNYDSFDLVINKGVGSPYENFMERLIAIATENTKNFVLAHKTNIVDPVVAEDLTHLLNVALFDAISEIFRKHYTKEEADFYMKNIFCFYNAGWNEILDK